jgi:hypothetical protein
MYECPHARRHAVTETARRPKGDVGPSRPRTGAVRPETADCAQSPIQPPCNPARQGENEGAGSAAAWGRAPRGCVSLLGMLGAIRFLSCAGALRCRPKGSNPAGPLALLARARGKMRQSGRQFCTRNGCGKLRTAPGLATFVRQIWPPWPLLSVSSVRQAVVDARQAVVDSLPARDGCSVMHRRPTW